MFERYNEPARRVIFFARYEASVAGSPSIEPEHLLLGLLRENSVLREHVTQGGATVESVRNRIQAATPVREKVSTSIDLPLSDSSQQVLTCAAEEASSLGHREIDCGHLVLGLLGEQDSTPAAILLEYGIDYDRYREVVKATTPAPVSLRRTRPVERESAWEDAAIAVAAPSLQESVETLQDLLNSGMKYLELYSEAWSERHLARKAWTRKQALGHLVDLATTHHRWVARALTEPNVVDSGPPLESWVSLQHYAEFPWQELVDLWIGLNRLLVHVLSRISEEKAGTPVRIGLEMPAPLNIVIERYVEECEDIVGQVLIRL